MPLDYSKSKKAFSGNVSELLASYKEGGKFAKGKSMKKARQMALATAFGIKRKGGNK